MFERDPKPFHDIDGTSDPDPGFNYNRERSAVTQNHL